MKRLPVSWYVVIHWWAFRMTQPIMNICVQVFMELCAAEMPRYTITLCLHFEELPNQSFFQSDYIIFRRERQHRQVSFLSLLLLFSHPCQLLMWSHFPYSYPNPCELIAHCGCISLMDNNTEHLFMHLLASPPPPCTPGKRNDSSDS